MANINSIREILNNPNEVSASEFDFTPISEETILTGILTVGITLDDTDNDLEVSVDFVGDASKAAFLANPQAKIVIGDIEFSAIASNLIDGGAGLPLIGAVALGDEFNAQADFQNFLANKRIEIRY